MNKHNAQARSLAAPIARLSRDAYLDKLAKHGYAVLWEMLDGSVRVRFFDDEQGARKALEMEWLAVNDFDKFFYEFADEHERLEENRLRRDMKSKNPAVSVPATIERLKLVFEVDLRVQKNVNALAKLVALAFPDAYADVRVARRDAPVLYDEGTELIES